MPVDRDVALRRPLGGSVAVRTAIVYFLNQELSRRVKRDSA